MRRQCLFALTLSILCANSAFAAIAGYVDDFNSGSDPGFWQSQADVSVVASGGVGGAGDGFLSVARPSPAQLGVFNNSTELTGDIGPSVGIPGYSFYLSDLGSNDNLEIHVAVGRQFDNLWIATAGFTPPTSGWQQFSVDLTNSAGWVQIQGSGTFADALMNTNRLLIRHDLAPFFQSPDQTAGDFGIDRVTVLPEPSTAVLLIGAAALMGRRRRRTV